MLTVESQTEVAKSKRKNKEPSEKNYLKTLLVRTIKKTKQDDELGDSGDSQKDQQAQRLLDQV